MSRMSLARWLGSRGRFGRLSMARADHRSREPSSPSDVKLRRYHVPGEVDTVVVLRGDLA